MPKVSIIVPMYNSAKFLDRCVQSLINQTLKDIEIILVNDASPDNSLEIARKYELMDHRIRVVDLKENIVASRNAGIKIAQGEYLGFVDADDWVEPEMYEYLYEAACEKTVDVVIGGIKDCYESGRIVSEELFKDCPDDPISVKRYVAQNGGRLFTNIWKRTLVIKEIYFMEHNLYCDTIVNAWYLMAKSFIIVHKDLYNYYINDYSVTHRKNSYAMFDRLSSAQDFYERTKILGLYEDFASEIDYIYYRLYFRNTLLQIGYLFTKVPVPKLSELRRHFNKALNIENNHYFQLHKNEISSIIARITSKNLFAGIITIQLLIIYLYIFKKK